MKCIRKISAVLLSVVTAITLALSLCACATTEQTHAMPEQLSFTAAALKSALNSGRTLDVKIEAEVYPSNAVNKEVDYSIAWKSGAQRASEQVTDYVTVTQDSDGSAKATVSCKKAFGSDKIIITVTTRDGGYTANCTVSFVGKATGIGVSTSQASKKSTAQRGEYYELGSGKTYTFDVNLTNDIQSVGESNITVATEAYGQAYFGTTSTDESGYVRFYEMQKKDISQFKDKLITVTASGTTITVTAPSTHITDFHDRDGYGEGGMGYYRWDKYVRDDEYGFYSGLYTADNFAGKVSENKQLIQSCYFTITVTDSVSKLSTSFRVWIEQSVTGVSLTRSLTV